MVLYIRHCFPYVFLTMIVFIRPFLGFIFLFFAAGGCGSSSEPITFNPSINIPSPPIIKRIDPASGKAGEPITIFGFGFSSESASNIIIVAGKATSADSYALVNPPTDGEIESLTFQVPNGATAGTGGISVTVFENTSNNDVQFTVNP